VENGNRIGSLSITPTVARQTPQNDFGKVFARTAQEVVRTGAGVVATLVPGSPAVSAAVSSISAVVSSSAASVGSTSATPMSGGAGNGAGGAAGTPGQGDQWDLIAAQKEMQAEGLKMNLAYMNLQNEMQKESRAHNAVSNIMKVRHDSAKSAINNIR
jgi:3-oxoacyl-ACP reductase-like protein